MRIKAFLLGIVCFFFAMNVMAAENDAAITPAGQIIVVSGAFRIIHANNTTVVPRRGDSFYSGDTLVTGSNGNAQVRFTDGGVLALKQNSALKIDNYRYTQDSSTDQSVMTFIKGGFRALTGLIAKQKPSSYSIQTPVAVIGVRGTNLGGVLTHGKLYTGVWKGNIVVQNQYGSITLGQSQDYNFSEVSPGQAPIGLLNPPPELGGECNTKKQTNNK